MAKKSLSWIVLVLMVGFFVTSCVSAPEVPLSPNASQSVIIVRRSDSDIEKREDMEILIDGRTEHNEVENGGRGQVLVMNGLHTAQVKIDKYQSQMVTFDCSSEVVEFFTNFEGSGRNIKLNLTKISGGDGRKNASNNVMPSIIVNVDNSSSNTASSSGNTSNNSMKVGDDNSVR